MKTKSFDVKLLLVLGVFLVNIIYGIEGQQCKRSIDLVFAMDASGSMTTRDFLKQKHFIQHLSRKFIISYRGTHAGVIVYSTRATIAIPLKKYHRWNRFERAVAGIPFERGDTRIDLALEKAQSIFKALRGGRNGVPKVLIVLTDGQQTMVQGEVPHLDKKVLPLRKQGVKVYAIGIGRYISRRQLRLLVEKPSDLLTARNFNTLRRHIYSITSRLCSGAIPPAYGFYPFNARYRGREISENRGPTARFSQVSRSWGPRGQHGGALYLRGQPYSFIEIPNRARGKLDTRTSTSIFLWVYLSRRSGPIVNYRRNGVGVGLFYYGRRTISANFVGRMGYFRRRLVYRRVSSRKWHYIGLTYDHRTGYGRLWMDGRQVRSRLIGRVLLATQYPIRLGSVSYMRRHFKGRVTCLQIYNAALNGKQIKAIRKKCNSPRDAIDPCQNRPCYNGGSCIKTPNSRAGFRCRCRRGYYGQLCQNRRGRPTMRPTRRPSGRPTGRPGGRPTRGPSGPTGRSTVPSGSTRPTRKPASPGSPIPNTNRFRMEIVEYINVFRRIHGVGPVIISDNINPKAQKWALYISSLGTAKTDPNSPYGRTICLRRGRRENTAKECVYEWYQTVKAYDWHDNTINTANMNFVQMIWKSSLRVGVGVIRGGRGRYYVVVYYDVPGTKVDQLRDNVPGFTDVYLMIYGATCEKGYVEYQGKCYKYHPEKVTWDEAVRRSTSDNATLLSLHDPREVDFLGRVPVKDKDDTIWIGLNNRIKESHYMNTDGSGIEYVDWKANEPDGGDERCVTVSVRQTFYRYGTMSDRKCTEKHQFVVEKPLEGIVTYRMTIDVLSLVWVDDLAIPGTLAFLQLKTKFEDAILKMYKGETNLVSVMIEWFSRKKPAKPTNKPGATKKPSSRPPTSKIPTSTSSNLGTPTSGGPGRPTRPNSDHKVTAYIILKFSQGAKPDPTLPFQDALKKNKGKLPAPVNEQAVITKIRIVKPGEGPALIGSCNPYCAYQCMSTCNPMCCSSKIATNAVNPMMANLIQRRKMAIMHKRNAFIPRMGINQRPCVPSPFNRCLPSGMQSSFKQGQMGLPMNQGIMQRPIYQGSQQQMQNHMCVPGARMPCPPGQGMRMPMQRQLLPMQNLLQRGIPMRQGCVPRVGVPCHPRQSMLRPMGPYSMRNPMMQRPYPMQNPMMQRSYPMPNPMMQRPYPMPNPMMQRPHPMPNPMMQRPYPMPNPMMQRPHSMPNPMMQRPYPMPNPMMQRPHSMPNPMMQRPYPMPNPVMQRPYPMPNPMMQRSGGQPCFPRAGMPCPPVPQMQMNPFMQSNPYLQGLRMWRQKQLMQRQSKSKKAKKTSRRIRFPFSPQVGCIPRPGFMCPPYGPMNYPARPAFSMQRPMGPFTPFGPQRQPYMAQTQFPFQFPRRSPMANFFAKRKPKKSNKPIHLLGAPLPTIYNIVYPPQPQFPFLMRPRCIPTPSKPCTKQGKSRSIRPAPIKPQTMQQYPYQTPPMMNMPQYGPYPQPLGRQFPMNRQGPMQNPFIPQQQPIVVQAADLPNLLNKVDNPIQQSAILALLQPRPMQYPVPQQHLGKKKGKPEKKKKKGKSKKSKNIEMTGPPLPPIHIIGYPLQPPIGYQTMNMRGPMPMQRPMPMPMPMQRPIQRPMPMPMRRPMPMPMPIQRPMPMPMQRPMPMPMQRPMPMPMQRPMPMPMQRPMQRPMPMPKQRPMPMPMQRPMPMPIQRPMSIPMQRPMPMPMQGPMPFQFPQPCFPTASKQCPPKRKNKTKKAPKKPKMRHFLGAPIPGPPPMTYILPQPPPPMMPMMGQPCIPRTSAPCPPPRGMPSLMQRPLPMPLGMPIGMPVQRPLPMPMQRPMPMPIQRPMPMPMQRPMPMPMQGPMPFQFPQPCFPTASKQCPPKKKNKTKKAPKKPKMRHFLGAPIPGPPPMTYILPQPQPPPVMPMMGQPCIPRPSAPCSPPRSMSLPMQRPLPMPMGMPMGMPVQPPLPMQRPMPVKNPKKNSKSKRKHFPRRPPFPHFGQMQNPMVPMPGNPCIPTLFSNCPPIGKPIMVSPNPFMPMQYRHPFAGLHPITPKPVSPVVVRLPNIILKYPVNQRPPSRPAAQKAKPRMSRPNNLPGAMPYGMQMPMQYPMPMGTAMGMPHSPPVNPFSPYINPRSCAMPCIKPRGVFCPSYCPKSCCGGGKGQIGGKKRSKIAKPK